MSANHTVPEKGLTAAEVAKRTEQGQCNRQPRTVGRSTGQIIAANLFTLFNLLNLLLAAALIAVGSYRNLLFLGVVVSNTFIGTIQELRAKRTIDKLQLLSAPQVQVVRDGVLSQIAMEEVVLGDLVVIRQGDQLCADGELAYGQGAMNESLLTGESEPVEKAIGDAMLSGSFVTEGAMYVRITKVGADSYATQLMARAKEIKQPHSELMHSMRLIVRTVGAAIIPLGAIQFVKQFFFMNIAIQPAVTSTVAAMLGMIPEGLVLLTSVALAVGVVRLGRQNTLVQELFGIESLARVDTLCVDKTGTLTRGTMSVSGILPLGDAQEAAIESKLSAYVSALEDDNATFRALRERFPAPANSEKPGTTVPFSSARKWSAASFPGRGTCVVGAAEFILGDKIPLEIAEKIAREAQQGVRVLLLCHSDAAIEGKTLPGNLQPRALLLLSDVLREDVQETLAFFREQDVAVKVISGDNPLTVANVARQAGLQGAESAVDATTLDTHEKLVDAATRYTIFGRVTPEQKKDLVDALKAAGHTVGMMGDGVNDIPALRASDCAIAMGGGSDAARRVSQLTLLDGNFSAVPHIVAEGRRVINNISRAASLFLVKTTFSFILSLLLVFIHQRYPFFPIQMTLISSLTIGIPSFFLALEPNDGRVQGNFLKTVLRNALPGGLTVVTLIVLLWCLAGPLGIHIQTLSTMATWITGFSGLLTLLFTCLPLSFTRLMLLSLMTIGFFGVAMVFGNVFYLVDLSTTLTLVTGGMMLLALPVMLLYRALMRRVRA